MSSIIEKDHQIIGRLRWSGKRSVLRPIMYDEFQSTSWFERVMAEVCDSWPIRELPEGGYRLRLTLELERHYCFPPGDDIFAYSAVGTGGSFHRLPGSDLQVPRPVRTFIDRLAEYLQAYVTGLWEVDSPEEICIWIEHYSEYIVDPSGFLDELSTVLD